MPPCVLPQVFSSERYTFIPPRTKRSAHTRGLNRDLSLTKPCLHFLLLGLILSRTPVICESYKDLRHTFSIYTYLQIAYTTCKLGFGSDISLRFRLSSYTHSLSIVKTAPDHRQVATPSQYDIPLFQGTNNVLLPSKPIIWNKKVFEDLGSWGVFALHDL